MGQIVGACATVHAPQLFTRPPTEVPEQMDADIAAMKLMGKELDELKPDAVIVLGSDHLETFFLSSVPTFAVIAGETSRAHFATKSYNMKVHLPLAEDILDKLVRADFDMAYSQDALLGHSFAAVYEWIIARPRHSRGARSSSTPICLRCPRRNAAMRWARRSPTSSRAVPSAS